MSSIAIITARGGSKRIPKKNIKDFCGKPIISYSIEAALESGVFDEVMVSTDSEEIAQVAREYGANVPFFRSKETSDDFATTADVLLEVLGEYEKRHLSFDVGCCLYPTAPFITSQILKDAYNSLLNSTAKTLLPVVAFSFPPQRGVFIRENRLVLSQPKYLNVRSQDIEKMYHDCGQFSMFKIPAFIFDKKLITDNTIAYIMKEENVQDIDNLSDWDIATIKYKMMKEKEENNN